MDVYLVLCQGQGDTQACIVDKETFEWIMEFDDGPLVRSKTVKAPPQLHRVLSDPEICKKVWGRYDPGDGSPDPDAINISCGSYQNDKALFCISTIDGYDLQYCELSKLINDVSNRGDRVVGEFSGFIY